MEPRLKQSTELPGSRPPVLFHPLFHVVSRTPPTSFTEICNFFEYR